MHTHPNARLIPLSRERLLRQHIDGGEPLKALSAQVCISFRTAYKWPARYRSGGHTSLADRVSAAPSGERSIRSNCSTQWISGTSAAPSGGSPSPLGLPCLPWDG